MQRKKHLFVGFGDIARRCSAALLAQGHEIVGIARGPRAVEGVDFWRGDVKSPTILGRVAKTGFDAVVITLTPSGSGEAAYRDAYYVPVKALCRAWESGTPPGRIVFVSSTSVYGQCHGEWVDHASVAEPSRGTAAIIRAAENLLLDFGRSVIVRFSGIYGPGRDYLLRQVMQGKGGGENYTNRIHVEDCCSVLRHVMSLRQDVLAPIYLASDTEPVKSREIRRWLAGQLGIDPYCLTSPREMGRAGNKRCDSSLLQSTGYRFAYPTYREGYKDAIKQFLQALER